MKRLFLPILSLCAAFAVSCTDYESQIEEAKNEIKVLEEAKTNMEICAKGAGSLRNFLLVAQTGDPIVSFDFTGEDYLVTFKNNGSLTLEYSAGGISAMERDGKYYWAQDGKILPGDAEITVTPEFRYSGEGTIEISVDGGKNWTVVTFKGLDMVPEYHEDGDRIIITLQGGTKVEMAKEATLDIMISGDGSTMVTDGTATVDFWILGRGDEFTVTPQTGDGWTSCVKWENNTKGTISFTAPAAGDNSARVYFCDSYGHAKVVDINFSSLAVDEDFPVMYPSWEAYNVGSDGGEVAVSLFTNQYLYDVVIEDGATWLANAATKAVREDVLKFTVEPNESADMRTARVTVSAYNYAQQFVICQDGKKTAAGQDLSADGTANCYIVSAAGDYSFIATVMGNGEKGLVTGNDFDLEGVAITPQKVSIVLNQNDVISDVRYDGSTGRIYFHANGEKGNAVISATNGRYSLWSWHIWCTDVPQDRTHTNPDGLQFTLLDRNLGALGADAAAGEDAYGLYYQWGRKDPYMREKVVRGMYTNTSHKFVFGIRYPERPYKSDGNYAQSWYGSSDNSNYLWGNADYGKSKSVKDLEKSIYDPCPLGYMVAPSNALRIFEDSSRTEYIDAGVIVHGDYGQENFFPYAGRCYQGSDIKDEIDLWHSTPARWDMYEDAGGCQTRIYKESGSIYFYQSDMRSRAVPVRCVKQVSE